MRQLPVCCFLVFLFLLLASCGPGKETVATDPFPVGAEAQMVFLDYLVEGVEGKSPRVTLQSIVFQPGTLKGVSYQREAVVPEGGVQCVQRGAEGEVLHRLGFENPLTKRIEYVDEEGHFAQKTVFLDSAHLLIRTMLHPSTEEIILAGEKWPVDAKTIYHRYPKQ